MTKRSLLPVSEQDHPKGRKGSLSPGRPFFVDRNHILEVGEKIILGEAANQRTAPEEKEAL